MNTTTSNKIALATLVVLATVTTARAEQDSRKNANGLSTGETIRDAGAYSPGKAKPRPRPTVGTDSDSTTSAQPAGGERKKGSKGRNANPLPAAGTQYSASQQGPAPRPFLWTEKYDYVEIPGILYDPMDMNLDGAVDDTDLLWLCKAFGTEQGDLNEDGITDGIDLGMMLIRLSLQSVD